jgi:hypothetical protein
VSYRYHGKARVDPTNPQAFAICDRCGGLYNHVDLQWQHQWIGPQLQNLRILVCEKCLDRPQEQLRTIILPPDPLPIYNARPERYAEAEIDWLLTQDGNRLTSADTGENLVKQQQTTVTSVK